MHHCTSSSRPTTPSADEQPDQGDERDLRRVRLAGWNIDSPANSPPISTPYRPPTRPPVVRDAGLDRVRHAEPGELGVGRPDVRGRSSPPGRRRSAHPSTTAGEVGVDASRRAGGTDCRSERGRPAGRRAAAPRAGRATTSRAGRAGRTAASGTARRGRPRRACPARGRAPTRRRGRRRPPGGRLRAAGRPGAAPISVGRLVAVRRARARSRNRALREVVLLGADGLDDVRRQQRADLGAALVGEAPREPGEEAGAEGVADAGRVGLALLRRAGAPRPSARPRARPMRRPWPPSVVTRTPTRSRHLVGRPAGLLLDERRPRTRW